MNEQDIKAALAAGEFDTTEQGLVFPAHGVLARGTFVYSKRGEPEEFSSNRLVTEGLTYMLSAALGGATPVGTWYMAIFSGNVTPLATWTGATFAGTATELTTYAAASRPAWTPTPAADNVISSYTAKTSFAANAAMTVRGAALLSASPKGDATGMLLAASLFGSEKTLSSGEVLDIGYQVELSPVV